MNSRQSQIIIRPIINEKTIALASVNKYTFEVVRNANKVEIASAMEQILKELFPKNKSLVEKVNTSAVRERFRRSRRHGRVPADGKKAIITISGDRLDMFSA